MNDVIAASRMDLASIKTPAQGAEFVKAHQAAVQACRAIGKDRATTNKYAERMVRGIRVTGKLIADLPREPGGRPKKGEEIAQTHLRSFADDAGIAPMTARNWQSLAAIPDPQFEAKLAELKATEIDDLITVGPFYDLAHFLRQENGRRERREGASTLGRSAHPDIHFKDFTDRATWDLVTDDSVALVFTDPPYDREALGLYDHLAEFAARKLMRGGSLVTYLGDYALPEVLHKILGASDLHFVWPLVCIHSGAAKTLKWGRQNGITVTSKLMLWFVKEKTERITADLIETAIESAPEKDTHAWQQSLIEAKYLIERLTPVDALVVDPFCGGATTYLASRMMGRNCVSFENDPIAYENAIKRVNDNGF